MPARRAANKDSSNGSTKASVLPVPVCAVARTSRPARAGGIACAWTAVGCTNPWRVRLLFRAIERGSSEKSFIQFIGKGRSASRQKLGGCCECLTSLIRLAHPRSIRCASRLVAAFRRRGRPGAWSRAALRAQAPEWVVVARLVVVARVAAPERVAAEGLVAARLAGLVAGLRRLAVAPRRV